MNSTKPTRLARLAADQKLIDGVSKFLSTFGSLPVDSQMMTAADIVKVLQARLSAGQAVQTAQAARDAAVKADRDERAKTATFVSSLRRLVEAMFAQSPDTLAAFGLTARRAAKKTVAIKATAVAKSKATRKARNTLGRKQKAKVKGTAPAAPPTPPSPTS